MDRVCSTPSLALLLHSSHPITHTVRYSILHVQLAFLVELHTRHTSLKACIQSNRILHSLTDKHNTSKALTVPAGHSHNVVIVISNLCRPLSNWTLLLLYTLHYTTLHSSASVSVYHHITCPVYSMRGETSLQGTVPLC